MLNEMRDIAGSWFIKMLLGAIVVVFVLWGVGNFSDERRTKVASVNGVPITIDEYRKSYDNLKEQYRRRFGGNLDENMIKMLNLKKMAIDRLVEEHLMREESLKLSFRISDGELAESISKVPAFQKDGAFDKDVYRRVLQANRMKPEEFEFAQREALLNDRLRNFVMDGVKVSDAEIQDWYEWNNASTEIQYVLFDPKSYKDMVPTQEEIQKQYEANKDNYKTEAKMKVRYLRFGPESYAAGVKITDEEIKEYFETHTDEFKEPKTVEARHILLKMDKNAPAEEVEKKKAKAAEIAKKAKSGKDFAQLAKEFSEDPGSKDKGGQLGKFRKEAMVKPFSDAAFDMKAGEISEPVRSDFGWHIIKVEKINEAAEKNLDQAKDTIRKKLSDERAKALAFDAAEDVYASAFQGDNLKNVAQERKLEINETDFFTRDKGPDKVKNASNFASVAFGIPENQISEVQDMGDGYYILQVMEQIKPETLPLEAASERIKAELTQKKQDEKAKADAEAFLAEMKKEGANLEALSAKLKLPAKSTGFFKRNAAIPDVGNEREISEAAFRVSKENPLPEKPLKGNKGYYVIRFKDRKGPEPTDFDKEKAQIKDRLLRQKQFKTVESWMAQLKEKSQIVIQEDKLN